MFDSTLPPEGVLALALADAGVRRDGDSLSYAFARLERDGYTKTANLDRVPFAIERLRGDFPGLFAKPADENPQAELMASVAQAMKKRQQLKGENHAI